MHQLANLGRGSVLGLNELLISESATYLTTVTCLSPEGELYKISKDIFYQKIQNTGPFIVRVKKAIEEQFKTQVKSVSNMQQSQIKITENLKNDMGNQQKTGSKASTSTNLTRNRNSAHQNSIESLKSLQSASKTAPIKSLSAQKPTFTGTIPHNMTVIAKDNTRNQV